MKGCVTNLFPYLFLFCYYILTRYIEIKITHYIFYLNVKCVYLITYRYNIVERNILFSLMISDHFIYHIK